MKEIIVGCCGFPCSKREYYRRFRAIEVQSTFYDLPTLITVKRWREESPPDFEFTIKAWQLITHNASSPTYRRLRIGIPEDKKDSYGSFKPTEEVFKVWQRILEIAKILKTKVILFQSPASFRPSKENIKNLKRFFKKIKGEDFLYAWEPRGGWPLRLIGDICNDLGLIHCVDPFFVEPQSTISINYFRLHGIPYYNLRYRYNSQDLKRLIDFCKDTDKNYVFFNNLNMFEDSLNLLKLLSDPPDKRTKDS